MPAKNKGGRGHKSDKRYERFTVTLPPDLKEQLDTLAASWELTRSGLLSLIMNQYFSGMSGLPEQVAPAPSLSLEGVTVLRVLSCTLPPALRNKLRWSPERYAALEADLSSGFELRMDLTNGKAVWRTVTGKGIRRDTVELLVKAGILTPEG
jgi:hypothetical protein